MFRAWLNSIAAALLFAGTAWGTPYWVEYNAANGNFPEAEGWTRYTLGGGAMRYFEDGALVLDDQGAPLDDMYGWSQPGALDPASGQIFVAQWRLCTSQLDGLWDSTVAVFSDQRRGAAFDFGWDSVHVPGAGTVATFEPATFHDFEFRSVDMLTYDLYVDSVHAYSGSFWSSVTGSLVGWGDSTQGVASVTRWEFCRFGVVPEPHVALLVVWLVAWGVPRHR